MKNRLKKIALACGSVAVIAAIVTVSVPARAAYNDGTATGSTNLKTGNVNLTDTGIYSNGTLRYQPGVPDQFTSGQVSMGASGTILSTATTSGFSLSARR